MGKNRHWRKLVKEDALLIGTMVGTFLAVVLILTTSLFTYYKASKISILKQYEADVVVKGDKIANVLNDGFISLEVACNATNYLVQNDASLKEIADYLQTQSIGLTQLGIGVYSDVYGSIEGTLVGSKASEMPADYNPNSRVWYETAMKAPIRTIVTEPYEDAYYEGRMNVTMARQLSDGENVLAVDLYLDKLQDYIESLEYNQLGVSVVVDSNGNVIASSDKTAGFDGVLYGYNRDGEVEVSINGTNYIAISKNLCDYWRIIVFLEKSTLLHDVRIDLYRSILLSMIILLLIGYYSTSAYINHKKEHITNMQLGQMTEQLREALQDARDANEAKSRFLFNISHDIRTPMNAIMGFADKAERNKDNADIVGDCLLKMKGSSNYLLRLLNDVLDMASIETGKTELEYGIYSLKQRADELTEIMRSAAKSHNVSIQTDFSRITHDFISMDAVRVRQIMTNILSNAIKYTNAGGTVQFRIRELECPIEGYGTYEFTIEDNGIGMSPDFLCHIFDQFERENSTTLSGVQGTGLGMAIVRRLVDLMRGDITIESTLHVGTTVKVYLDFVYTDSIPVVEEKQVSDYDPFCIKGRRILLVEDNELNREIARDMLEDSGAIVDEAEDGIIAVDKIANSFSGRYDIILMDIQMPRMDGYEATRRIRALDDRRLARIPIVALTANAFEEDRRRAIECGMDAHVSKPVHSDELVEAIEQVLREKG